MSALFDLKGKRALITGGTHGLGMAMAKGLASAGAQLIINGHSSQKMDAALEEYQQAGIKAHASLFDVTDEAQVKKAVDTLENTIGPIDILINNAGIIKRIPILEMEADEFREVINVDLVGPFIVSKHVGRHMIGRRSGK